MAITYINDKGVSISENQLTGLTKFFRITTLNGAIKTKEYFLDGEFFALYYYRLPNENIQEVLQNNIVPGHSLVIVDKVIYTDGYLLEKNFTYNPEMELNSISNTLFDPNGEAIGYEWIDDLVNNIPDYTLTKKYYYNRSVNHDDNLFECSFNNDGSLLEIYYNSYHTEPTGQDSEVFFNTPEDISTLRQLTGISQQLAEYYMVPQVTPNF